MTDYQMVPIDSLKPSGYNPNVLTPDQYAALVAEISVQGRRLLKPIVANEQPDQDGRHPIIDGEHNWRAAMEVGLTEVPVELIEADGFEARRQMLIRNRTGRNDNLKLGRVYADMIAARSLTYRDLAAELKISHGTVRNMLLYPMAWDLLSMHGQPLVDDAGQPVEPECYSFGQAAYTEPMVSKMSVRHVRDLVARLQGLVDEGESEQRPDDAPAEEEHVRLAKLHLSKCTDDGRQNVMEWLGVVAAINEALRQASEAYDKGFKEGRAAQRDAELSPPVAAKRKPGRPRKQQANGAVTQQTEPELVNADQQQPEAVNERVWRHYVGEDPRAAPVLEYFAAQPDAVSESDLITACGLQHQVGRKPPRPLGRLKDAGYIRRVGFGRWIITDSGRAASAFNPEPATLDNSYTERGSRIRAERNAKGLTAKELAKLVGIAPNYVSMAELGRLTKSGGPAAGRPAFDKLEAFLGLTSH